MARLLTILRAVARAARRGSKSLLAVRGNNLLYAGFAMLLLADSEAFGFFLVLIVIVLFLPLSSDPLALVPRERLNLWPLTARERFILRLLSPLLNPLLWLILAAMIWRGIGWGPWAVVAGVFACGFVGSSFSLPNIWVPRIPAGVLTQIVRKDLRQLLTALDFYCALLIASLMLYFRLAGELPADAFTPLTALLVIAMSTMPLTLFGLDGKSGMERYSLWSLPGWSILLAKAIAYLLLVLLVTLPLSPVAGLAGGFVALAVGQYASLRHAVPQSRWRFRAASSRAYSKTAFAYSVVEMLLAIAACVVVAQFGALWLALCVAIYALSLWFCGRRFPVPAAIE